MGGGRAPNPLHLTLWMLVPVPMLALSLVIEGSRRIWSSLDPTAPSMLPVLLGFAYTVLGGSIIGSALWSWLVARHPSGVVAPFSMLVPVVGMSVAWLVLDEAINPGEAAGAAMVVGGVLLGSGRSVQPGRGRVELGRLRRDVQPVEQSLAGRGHRPGRGVQH